METRAINGSPRKRGNSGAILKSWVEDLKERTPGIQWVNLYDFAFKGCHCCFACKQKNGGS